MANQYGVSKWAFFDNEIKIFFEQNPTLTHVDCAKNLQPNLNNNELHAFNVYIKPPQVRGFFLEFRFLLRFTMPFLTAR